MKPRLAAEIKHQQQPTACSCLATCIAMAIGEPVEKLGIRLDRPFGPRHYGVWLAERGIWMRPMVRADTRGELFMPGTVYLLCVRSLNMVNSDHAVLLDTRGERAGAGFAERSNFRFFDPNEGRPGLKAYRWVDENELTEAHELVVRQGEYLPTDLIPE